MSQVPASIFRAYDIRGIVDETLTEDGVRAIGQSIGSEAGCFTCVVGILKLPGLHRRTERNVGDQRHHPSGVPVRTPLP